MLLVSRLGRNTQPPPPHPITPQPTLAPGPPLERVWVMIYTLVKVEIAGPPATARAQKHKLETFDSNPPLLLPSSPCWLGGWVAQKKDKYRRQGKGRRCCFGNRKLFNSLLRKLFCTRMILKNTMNSSFSSNHPGTIHFIPQFVLQYSAKEKAQQGIE